jgi:hypothetical protein
LENLNRSVGRSRGPEPSETTEARAGRPMRIKPVSVHEAVAAKSRRHKKPMKPDAT